MAGPKIPWRPGRIVGFAAQFTFDGRLPEATQGADHLRSIFYRMGTWRHMRSAAATLIVPASKVYEHTLPSL